MSLGGGRDPDTRKNFMYLGTKTCFTCMDGVRRSNAARSSLFNSRSGTPTFVRVDLTMAELHSKKAGAVL